MDPALNAALRECLAEAARFDAEYGAGLSNHLPMALTALARLGADGGRLREFAAAYSQRLHAAPPGEPWPAGDAWRARLGDPRAWPAYRRLFRDWMAHEGASAMLAQALPALMQGVGAAAFHGPIRAAYALSANHADGLADALAYWACRWFSCGEPAADGRTSEPASWLAALDAIAGALADSIAGAPLIAVGMAHAAAHPRFIDAASRIRVEPRSTLPRLAKLAAERYAAGADFTVLHLVTSAHAVLLLLPWLDGEPERATALAHYARAFAAAWATRPLQRRAVPLTRLLPWPEIVARAVDSGDDHEIKLVDTCRELERAWGGAAWNTAASRAVG